MTAIKRPPGRPGAAAKKEAERASARSTVRRRRRRHRRTRQLLAEGDQASPKAIPRWTKSRRRHRNEIADSAPSPATLSGVGLPDVQEQAFRNFQAVLKESGCALTDVAKTTVFLQSLGDFAAVRIQLSFSRTSPLFAGRRAGVCLRPVSAASRADKNQPHFRSTPSMPVSLASTSRRAPASRCALLPPHATLERSAHSLRGPAGR